MAWSKKGSVVAKGGSFVCKLRVIACYQYARCNAHTGAGGDFNACVSWHHADSRFALQVVGSSFALVFPEPVLQRS
jgi:hypothetical protein